MFHRSRWSINHDGGGTRSLGGQGVLGVENAVGVALLGEEALAVSSEVSVDGVPGDDRVEPCRRALRLGPEQAPQALGLLLSGAKGPRYLDSHLCGRQVD